MNIISTPLAGLLVFEPRIFADDRGFFLETFQKERYAQAGISNDFVQDNHSHSHERVLRGLHFQKQHPQGKLVFVMAGEVFDVVVDIRPGSPTFGQWYGTILSTENHRQVYVPSGMAHGFVVISGPADFYYKCTDYYHPGDEGGLAWNDPDLGIIWPVTAPILNPRDAAFPRLRDIDPADLPRIGRLEAAQS